MQKHDNCELIVTDCLTTHREQNSIQNANITPPLQPSQQSPPPSQPPTPPPQPPTPQPTPSTTKHQRQKVCL